MTERYSSTLEWYTGERGYGFVVEMDGKQEFVRYIPEAGGSYRILMEGNRFDFEVAPNPRGGFVAVNITNHAR